MVGRGPLVSSAAFPVCVAVVVCVSLSLSFQGADGRRMSVSSLARVQKHATLGASLTCPCPEGVLAPRRPGWHDEGFACTRPASAIRLGLAALVLIGVRLELLERRNRRSCQRHATLGASLTCPCPEGVLAPRRPGWHGEGFACSRPASAICLCPQRGWLGLAALVLIGVRLELLERRNRAWGSRGRSRDDEALDRSTHPLSAPRRPGCPRRWASDQSNRTMPRGSPAHDRIPAVSLSLSPAPAPHSMLWRLVGF
jgi:hypothetical protein